MEALMLPFLMCNLTIIQKKVKVIKQCVEI
jgi:hypothetical protein